MLTDLTKENLKLRVKIKSNFVILMQKNNIIITEDEILKEVGEYNCLYKNIENVIKEMHLCSMESIW